MDQKLSEHSKFSSLPFNPGEDAIDHGKRIAENANRWLESQELNFAKAYVGGDLEICVGYDVVVQM